MRCEPCWTWLSVPLRGKVMASVTQLNAGLLLLKSEQPFERVFINQHLEKEKSSLSILDGLAKRIFGRWHNCS
jgi:hypothetical protein